MVVKSAKNLLAAIKIILSMPEIMAPLGIMTTIFFIVTVPMLAAATDDGCMKHGVHCGPLGVPYTGINPSWEWVERLDVTLLVLIGVSAISLILHGWFGLIAVSFSDRWKKR